MKKKKTKHETYIIIETTVFVPEHIKVSEGIVGREVLKLNKELWEDVFHRFHELVHEFVHLLLKNKERLLTICQLLSIWSSYDPNLGGVWSPPPHSNV